MSDCILMVKDGEQKPVHPGNVANHLRAGWQLAEAPASEETASPTAEEIAAVEDETDAAPEPVDELAEADEKDQP